MGVTYDELGLEITVNTIYFFGLTCLRGSCVAADGESKLVLGDRTSYSLGCG